MKQFPKAHLWMLLPFLVASLGFYFSYWSKFTQVPFHQHLHGLTATSWYVLLIIQPYLYSRSKMKLHRFLGFVGVFLAGGVVFSALQIIPNNLTSGAISTPVLRYGFTFYDFLVLIGFIFSVFAGIYHRNNLARHARYLISSAFWVLIPALARLIYFPIVVLYGYPAPISFVQIIYICIGLILIPLGIMIILDYKTDKKIYRAYLLVAAGIASFAFFELIGSASWWINFCDQVIAR